MNIVPMTVSVLVVAFHESSPTGSFAGPTRHVYEDAGVRSNTVGTLLFRGGWTVSFARAGGVPLRVPVDAVQSVVGPGIASVYQAAQSETGMAITGAGFV